ncbi:hypothetical protein B0H67DRAFT_662716 [Lasiosphaeris hirsuta]|uniref:Uncharacterized protein n=1 Tax=Lasiosphaeris hirsuta TaxID=260670 RepID=A0AA40AR72_9PEZI|nr:hypothetical protein B0H67DRAFT_662716 [Lasiosphaeris hirsuta]
MTNHPRGSSLVQARKNHNHRHLHSSQHARDLQESDGGNHIRSPEEKLQDRQVVVVQTVSVVRIIDDTGAVIGLSTLVPDPATELPDLPAAATAGLTDLDSELPSVSAPGSASGDGAPSSTSSAQSDLALSSSILSSLSGQETLTSAPYSSPTNFSLLSTGAFNSSSSRFPTLFGNSTALFSNSTRTSSSRTSASSTTSGGSSNTLTSLFIVPTPAGGPGSGDTGAPTTLDPAATSSEAPRPSGSGLTPATQSAVIGGVVGSVAGVALIALFLMFLLKWKKGKGGGLLLLRDGDSMAGGRGPSSGPKGGMVERSVPFAVPSALASLTGGKRAIEDSTREPSEEKGFYRVSGKKLISVLHSGGDGYSDPHDSMISGTSDYRNSEAFISSSSMQRLQLGSPMRPVSGVPIMRSGPSRTPIQAQGPFSDGPRPVTPPTTNPLNRSLTSGAVPRFTEDM